MQNEIITESAAADIKNDPPAYALVTGGTAHEKIRGTVAFSDMRNGTRVDVYITGLPDYRPAPRGGQPISPFGFHIHEGAECSPVGGDTAFSGAKGHYNPDNQPHGNHAGDFPVLFSNRGTAQMSFFTDRFKPEQVVGKTVIIHENPDDYRTQPAGNSGRRIACGVIRASRRASLPLANTPTVGQIKAL